MPDRTEKLKAMIRELETELASLDSIDPETRDVLANAIAEISDTLRKKEPGSLEGQQSLVERLEEAAEGFESSHPTLSGIVGRMVNALGQMGI